jgi:hypothetical protein
VTDAEPECQLEAQLLADWVARRDLEASGRDFGLSPRRARARLLGAARRFGDWICLRGEREVLFGLSSGRSSLSSAALCGATRVRAAVDALVHRGELKILTALATRDPGRRH